jgi:hypothetical protein
MAIPAASASVSVMAGATVPEEEPEHDGSAGLRRGSSTQLRSLPPPPHAAKTAIAENIAIRCRWLMSWLDLDIFFSLV